MSGSQDEIPPPPPPPPSSPQTPTQQTPHTVSTIKLPILKKGEYDIWAMKMEHYLAHTDYPIWEVIQNGNGLVLIIYKIYMDKLGHFARECRIKGNQDNRRRGCMDSGIRMGSRTGKRRDSKALEPLNGAESEQSDARIEIKAYSQGLKKVKAQLVAHQQEAQKEKEDLKAKVEKWQNSSKNFSKLLNTQMSANDKFGLGYGDHRYDGILSYENEVLQSVFINKETELENQPLNDRFAEGMHAVPPPMRGNYMPSGPDIEIDYSQFTYGPKQTQPSESESQSSECDTCESNISTELSELVSEPVVIESNGESQPKQVKTPRETVKNQYTHSQKPKVDKKDLGYGFAVRACFVCGSLNHLIKDCDFHEKRMARKAELNNGWNNVQRVNKQNQFVPSAVLTRTGIIPVSTARASSTKNFSTARQSFNRQTVLTNTAMKVNTVKPIVNRDYPHRALKNKGIVDSVGCSRHLTKKHEWWNGNKPTLLNFKTLMWPCLLSWRYKGIKREYSNARTPQQNGVAERKNRTLIEAARTMLADSFLPNTSSGWKRDLLCTQFGLYASIITPALKSDDKREGQERKNKSLWMNLKDLRDKKRKLMRKLKLSGRSLRPWLYKKELLRLAVLTFLVLLAPAKASSTNLVNTVSIPVSTASPYEGLSLSDPTNLRR
ncbi:ribonuclease H-like domain-containing protein [Tanacetum coccineum]